MCHSARNRPSKNPHNLMWVGRKNAAFESGMTDNSWPDTWWMRELKELKCFVAMCWHVCIAVAESRFQGLTCQCHLFKEIETVLLPHITLILGSFSWLSMMKSYDSDSGMSQAKGFAYLAAT